MKERLAETECVAASPPEPRLKEIICANMKHIPTCCGGFGRGGGSPTGVFSSQSHSSFLHTLHICKRENTYAQALCQGVCMRAQSERSCVKMMTSCNDSCASSASPLASVFASTEGDGGGGGVCKIRDEPMAYLCAGTHTQITHLAFCPITGNIEPKGSGPISKESACNERSEARFYHGQ